MKLTRILPVLAMGLLLASCGGKKDDKAASDSTTQTEEKVEAQTANVPFLESMPIEGKNADYFAANGADGTANVTLTGTPNEDGKMGTIRATVKLDVKKQFANLKGFATFPPMTLYFLNADKEEIESSRLEMSKADQDAIIAELKKPNPGIIEITYKGEFYASTYNKLFKETKYVQIQSADLSDGSSSSDDSDESVDGLSYDPNYDLKEAQRRAERAVEDGQEAAQEAVDMAKEAYGL